MTMPARMKRIRCLGNRLSTDNVISHRVLRIATDKRDARMGRQFQGASRRSESLSRLCFSRSVSFKVPVEDLLMRQLKLQGILSLTFVLCVHIAGGGLDSVPRPERLRLGRYQGSACQIRTAGERHLENAIASGALVSGADAGSHFSDGL